MLLVLFKNQYYEEAHFNFSHLSHLLYCFAYLVEQFTDLNFGNSIEVAMPFIYNSSLFLDADVEDGLGKELYSLSSEG